MLTALQRFWVHMAKKDRMHFNSLLLLCEVSNDPSPDDLFQVIGCGKKDLSGFFTAAT